ncbi:hypothetical protein [Luteolibacter sp. LG18]|uniref:hypothetical protein n=1 Tax=Luteolibacter sp. LG18 TaxID=2819286 RepID=UPI002B28202B|nr:hypothetical protein llg_07340 [Luteolibacter sp. LG18]BCU79637.1 hypothetical protein llg_43520 [Luteolibacter sp. LG18]
MIAPRPVIPDIIDEQQVAEMLAQAADLHQLAEGDSLGAVLASSSSDGAKMADEIAEYLDVVAGNMKAQQSAGVPIVERLRDYARQIQAWFLMDLAMDGGGPDIWNDAATSKPEGHVLVFSGGDINSGYFDERDGWLSLCGLPFQSPVTHWTDLPPYPGECPPVE